MPERYMATFYKIFANRLTFQRKLFIYTFCLNSRKHVRMMVGAQLEGGKKTVNCKGPVGPDALPYSNYLCVNSMKACSEESWTLTSPPPTHSAQVSVTAALSRKLSVQQH